MPPQLMQLFIGLGMYLIGGMMMSNAQKQERPSLKDHPEPTSDSQRLVPFVVGTVRVDGLNLMFRDNRNIKERMVSPPGGKK